MTQEQAPQVIAINLQSEIGQAALAKENIEVPNSQSSFSGIELALILSFVAMVTVSRRKV